MRRWAREVRENNKFMEGDSKSYVAYNLVPWGCRS
jgi:hypothetical protein